MANVGFPFLSSSCMVIVDLVSPSATRFDGSAVILSCVGVGAFGGLFPNFL